MDWGAGHLTIIYSRNGGGIFQQKLPAGPGILTIFSNARGFARGGMLAAGIDSHISSAFKCVITSVPTAERQSFYERSARVSSLVSFSYSGSVRSPFGIRRIVIPRPHKNQNARTSPVLRPTETRPRGLLIDQAIARKTRVQHKVNV